MGKSKVFHALPAVALMLCCASLAYSALGDKTVIGPTSGLVPKTTTVNGHPLTGNVAVTAADTGALSLGAFGSYSTATQTKITAKADKSTTINSKPLSGNITLTYTDVGAEKALLVQAIDAASGIQTVTLTGVTTMVTKLDNSANAVRVLPDGVNTISGAPSLDLSLQFEAYVFRLVNTTYIVK